jgi:hypothetical protein
MLKKHRHKYDIAFSVAEEDLFVAEQIAAALRFRGISYYLYIEHRSANFGKSILEITGEIYTGMAKYVLMITSSIFVQKYWAGIESQFAQFSGKKNDAYVLQIRLDDTQVDGLSRHIVFEKWRNNADEIAAIIAEKLVLKKKQELKRKSVKILLCISFFTVAAAFVVWSGAGNKSNAAISAVIADTISKKPVVNNDSTEKGNPHKNTDSLPGLADTLINPVKPVDAGNMQDTVLRDDTAVIDQPVNTDSVKQFEYYIIVEGNDSDFTNQVAGRIKAYLQSKAIGVTENRQEAKNIISIKLTTATDTDGEDNNEYASCKYDFRVIKSNGAEDISSSGEVGRPVLDGQNDLSDLLTEVMKIMIVFYERLMIGDSPNTVAVKGR